MNRLIINSLIALSNVILQTCNILHRLNMALVRSNSRLVDYLMKRVQDL